MVNGTSSELIASIAQPVAETVGSIVAPFMQWISLGIGGLFGLYTIYFIIKLLIDRHRLSVLHQVQSEIKKLEKSLPSKQEVSHLTKLLESFARKESKNTLNVKKSTSKKSKTKKQRMSSKESTKR